MIVNLLEFSDWTVWFQYEWCEYVGDKKIVRSLTQKVELTVANILVYGTMEEALSITKEILWK